jgi:23S rRNA (uridine2552-2'-O)-methyltransferase
MTNERTSPVAGPKATKKHKFVKAWVQEHVNDHWVKEATRLGYRSRAAFKLLELAEKDQLLRAGMSVVDLGSAPGVGHRYCMPSGQDRADRRDRPVADGAFARCHVHQGDFREQDGMSAVESALLGRKVDLVVSDLAPNLSGVEVRIRRGPCIWVNWHWISRWHGCNRAAIWSSKRSKVAVLRN